MVKLTCVDYILCMIRNGSESLVRERFSKHILNTFRNTKTIRNIYSIKEISMLNWAFIFLIVAVIAGILGFGGIAGTAASLAQALAVIFLILFVGSLIFGRRRI
jgi:uncharacterized membrane protein YtjA (UPF0391 family)